MNKLRRGDIKKKSLRLRAAKLHGRFKLFYLLILSLRLKTLRSFA
jgi:hypothetical protein